MTKRHVNTIAVAVAVAAGGVVLAWYQLLAPLRNLINVATAGDGDSTGAGR